MSARDRRREPVHKLNAYTWLGRRMECALTGDHYVDTDDWGRVTCADCLTEKPERAEADS